jgi:hypothetical protein
MKHPASAAKARIQPAQAWPPKAQLPFNQWIGWKYVIYNTGATDAKYRWFSVREIQAP